MRRRPPVFAIIVFAICSIIIFAGVFMAITKFRRGTSGAFYHFAMQNETLNSVAHRYSASAETIARLNGLHEEAKLYANQPLLIPRRSRTYPGNINRLDAYCDFPEGVQERKWQYIVVHHSATTRGNGLAFNGMHLSRGWSNGLGYDFVIGNGTMSPDGGIEIGPRWARQMDGSHTRGEMNRIGIGICLVGDFNIQLPTAKQQESLLELVRYLRRRYRIPRENVIGHKEAPGASTDCPGKRFNLNALRRSL